MYPKERTQSITVKDIAISVADRNDCTLTQVPIKQSDESPLHEFELLILE